MTSATFNFDESFIAFGKSNYRHNSFIINGLFNKFTSLLVVFRLLILLLNYIFTH